MAGLLTAADQADLAATFAAALMHTYSRASDTAGSEDAWGQASHTPGTAVSGLPCFYLAGGKTRIGAEGAVIVEQPTLAVLPSDPLKPDDTVTQILDSTGALIEPGPLRVTRVDDEGEGGIILARRATLAGGRAE